MSVDRERIEAIEYQIWLARTPRSHAASRDEWVRRAMELADHCEQLLAALAAAEAENARLRDEIQTLSHEAAASAAECRRDLDFDSERWYRGKAAGLRIAYKALASRPGEEAAS